MDFLRSTIFNLWFYLGTTVIAASAMVPRLLRRWMPAGWALGVAKTWAAFTFAGLRWICGTRWEVRGRENLPADGPALIVSMHQSAFDTMAWFLIVPRATYVLKKELTKIPLIGPMLHHLGMIAVDRDAGATAIRALLKGADGAMADRRQIVIFPEGTRVASGTRAPLHPGFAAIAARTRLPIIPVTTDSGLCWGRRAFRKHPGVIHIDVDPPMPAGLSRQEMTDRLDALFAAATAEQVAKAARQ